MADEDKLKQLRIDIDAVDKQLMDLISQRARLAQDVAEVKNRTDDAPVNFYRPEREAQILRKVIEQNNGPLSEEEMARLFREIMSACLALEQPLDIAYLVLFPFYGFISCIFHSIRPENFFHQKLNSRFSSFRFNYF